LLAFGAGIDSRIKERAQKPAVAQKDAKKLVVIDVYCVKSRGVKQVFAIDKNSDASTVPEFPRRACSRIKLHCRNLAE
jgi:hypothetical protein